MAAERFLVDGRSARATSELPVKRIANGSFLRYLVGCFCHEREKSCTQGSLSKSTYLSGLKLRSPTYSTSNCGIREETGNVTLGKCQQNTTSRFPSYS